MTVVDLHTHFICRNDNEKRGNTRQHHLSDVEGVLGVDTAAYLYRAVSTPNGAAVIDIGPYVPLYHAFQTLCKMFTTIRVKHKKDILLAIDGRPHPMKAATKRRRKQQREEGSARTKLNKIYEAAARDPAAADYSGAQRQRQNIAAPRDDLIAMLINWCKEVGIPYCCAPFEADWQLIALQQMNIINGIMTDDGDLFILGGDNIITDTCFTSGKCCIYRREDILARESMGSGAYADHLPALACFLGCDYIRRIEGNGPVNVRKIMAEWITLTTLEQQQKFIENMERSSRWKKADNQNAVGFAKQFWNAHNLFLHAPVFRLSPTNCNNPMDIHDDSTFEVHMKPLNSLYDHGSGKEFYEAWGNTIGFNCDPTSQLSGPLKPIFTMIHHPSTGAPRETLPLPKLQIEPFYDVPHGSYLDNNIPLGVQSDWALYQFMKVRGLAPKGKYIRKDALRRVKKILALIEKHGSNAPQPKEYVTGEEHGYSNNETLLPPDGNEVIWSKAWDELASALESLDPLNDNSFVDAFGKGRNGIQTRAIRLIVSGHFNIDKIQIANVRLKSNNNPAIAIRMQSVPSMKSEAYWVLSVFDSETKKFVCPPCSRCDCPAGYGCSHSRAQYAILSAIQLLVSKGHSKSDIVAMFPEALETLKGKPIPWDHAFQFTETEKELKRLKKLHNKVAASQSGYFEDLLNSIDAEGEHSEDSGDSDWDSDNATEASNESDEEEDEYVDLDEEYVEEEDEEWDLDDIVDVAMGDDSSDEREIKLCERVHSMLHESALYAKVSGRDMENTNEYKIERGKIDTCLHELLDGKDTPDESVENKLYQLQVLHKLDECFVRKEMDNCLLSFYLMHTRKQRAVMKNQLEVALNLNRSKRDLHWTTERLSKLLAEYSSLADRGFAGCSPDYPNFNGVRHPSFLHGRDQFSFEEVMMDRDDCQARYGSEAFFSRITDLEFLQDRVPRHRFHHFQNALYWAMGRANLNQPYYVPHGADEYFPKCADDQQQKRQKRSHHNGIHNETERADASSAGIDALASNSSITNLIELALADKASVTNFIDIAMPQEYIDLGLSDVGLLNDGKDFVTDTVRLNSCISRGQYSDKMKSSAARFIAWILPCGLSVTYTPLFLGRVSEKALVRYWGGTTYGDYWYDDE
jgi:5'-3' exonuclease